MENKENFTKSDIVAAAVGAIVENKTIDETLKEMGLSEKDIFSKWIAPQSSDAAAEYAKEVFTKFFADASEKTQREKGSSLYVVKKVLCNSENYKAMAEAVSGKNTDKFKVLRLIGSDAQTIQYKQKDEGLEYYLVTGKNSLEIMRKTTAENPVLQCNGTDLHPWDIKRYDEMFTDIIYNHTPESVERFINSIKA